MKRLLLLSFIGLMLFAFCNNNSNQDSQNLKFVTIKGQDLIKPNGDKLFIRGTNFGNWLNPEGYMFEFRKTNSPQFINQALSQLVGPDQMDIFWKNFKENYITKADVDFLASQGVNTIRIPFHYALFTNQDYMGKEDNQDGFALIDSVIKWVKPYDIFLILDMHDTPGGQTGDNIDDSYGYPWLLTSRPSQEKFFAIWKKIANYYKNETKILGYELCNEPIAHYFDAKELNPKLEPLYIECTKHIREVDTNHIILLGGAQWNGTFDCFNNFTFDKKIMFTCHRYGGNPTPEAIMSIIKFKDSTNLPMYMGELGHNTFEWQSSFCKTLEDNNIGYTFWPYKKIGNSCCVGIKKPEDWQKVIDFVEADRSTYKQIRELRFNQDSAISLLNQYIQNSRFENCIIDTAYINSIKLK